jgi:hypothetical protein
MIILGQLMMYCDFSASRRLLIYLFWVLWFIISVENGSIKSVFWSFSFWFSTYLIIILGVGHNAKSACHCLYACDSRCSLVFRRNTSGGLLTMFAAALEINANHFQMTYYLLIYLSIVYFIYKKLNPQL